MLTKALAAGALLAAAATGASAQVYQYPYTYDPYYGNRAEYRGQQECWNPRAGHFEAERPGEVQNDLDFSRCRPIGGRYYEPRRVDRDYRYYGTYRQECWNPRAGHFEEVRPGDIQNDLDFGRCRMVRY